MPASDSGMSGDEFDYSPAPVPLPEGVQKEIVEKGDEKSWKKPKEGDELTVHYVGTLEADGSQFDSSRDRDKAITFTIGKGEVIKGWDLGIATMTKGEKAKLTLAPEYAYGEQGQPPTIPPNATLVFEVELISWVSKDDLFGDGGAVKAVVNEGKEIWTHPKKNGEVCISVKATSQKGDIIEERNLFDYVIGSDDLGVMGRVVDKTLLNMSKEEKCSLLCEKGYVYDQPEHGRVTIEVELHEMYETNDVSLLKDSTVMKKTIKEGDGHDKPEDGYSVTLKVESVTDAAGNTLPGFVGEKELCFSSCNGEICDALEGAAREMKKGERAVVTCTAPWKIHEQRLGLSSVTAQKVVLILEMIDFGKGREQWRLTDDDKVDMALMRKDVGAQLFKAKRFEMALDKYNKVLETIGSHDSFNRELKKHAVELKRTIELNKAACYLQLGDPTNALSSCNKVLKEDRNNTKAMFRRAKAHAERNENVEAIADLERLLELDPKNAEARAMIPQLRRAQKKADKQSSNTFARMCEGFGSMGDREKPKAEQKEEEEEPEPEVNKDVATVAFRIEYKPQEGEAVYVVGQPEPLGAGENSKGIALTKLPQKWEPPTGSGKAPPEYHFWEATIELRVDLGRFEYKYLIRGPNGDRLEEGGEHKCDLNGMGGSRVRQRDSWRGEGR